MASPISEVSVEGMRQVHFEQLRAYIAYRKEDGWYCGDKAHFEKRNMELTEWVDGIIRLFELST